MDTLHIRVYLSDGIVTLLFRVRQERTLLIPAVLTGLCGIGYGVYCQYAKNAADEPRAI